MNLKTLAAFLGWCTVINFALLILAAVVWIAAKDSAGGFVAHLFGVTTGEVNEAVLQIILQYRGAIVFLNLVPYIAVKIVGSKVKSEMQQSA